MPHAVGEGTPWTSDECAPQREQHLWYAPRFTHQICAPRRMAGAMPPARGILRARSRPFGRRLSLPAPLHPLHIVGEWFVDPSGRRILLRGVNLGGSSKVPTIPPGATHLPTSLHPAEPRSFVGRPFPLTDAAEHFGRLRRWGFNLLRLVTTWEALEHAGPGQYDAAYLDWFVELVARAGEYGFFVFIDFHQDAWGRWSGGDGAPFWTYPLVGLNPATFDAAEAAFTMQRRFPNYPPMSWTSNGLRFAAQTMMTLFFSGDAVAPAARIDGEGIQGYLQRHFVAAAQRLAARLVTLPHVLGYGFLNEIGPGYLGTRLDQPQSPRVVGPRLSGFDGMVLAAGIPRRVPMVFPLAMVSLPLGCRLLNPQGVSAWLPDAVDLWRAAGVWDIRAGVPQLLRPDHFVMIAGRVVQPQRDYVQPMVRRFAQALQAVHPGTCLFVEHGGLGTIPTEPWPRAGLPPLVQATHWYDALTLVSQLAMPWWSIDVYRGRLVVGRAAVQRMFVEQLARIKAVSRELMGGCPTLIGEFGLPFNLNGGTSLRSGDYHVQAALLARYYHALDANLLSAAQWNYTADNDHTWGDQWNREDLSIYSTDDRARGDDGARALQGFCRPYARATAGLPLEMQFDPVTGTFHFRYRPDLTVVQPTEIVVPQVQYPQGAIVTLTHGHAELDAAAQILRVWAATPAEQLVVIRRPL